MNAMMRMMAVAAMAVTGMTGFAAGFSSEAYSFTYQASLRDENGNPIVKDGAVQRNQKVTLRIWSDPTTTDNLLWARKYAVYTDETGLFNLEVSDATSDDQGEADGYGLPRYASLATALTSQDAGKAYIGLFVEGSAGEIVPRQRLFAVPYAAVANDVRTITTNITVGGNMQFGGVSSGLTLSKDGINQAGTNSSSFANLSVGTRLSAATLTVNGGSVLEGGVGVRGGLTVGTGDVLVNRGSVAVSNDLTVAGNAAVGGGLEVGGGLKVDGTITDAVAEVVPVPVGGIIMWTKKELPAPTDHWAICDGRNGTPDLLDRFIVGAGKTYKVRDTGGTNEVALTKAQMPNHTHAFVMDNQVGVYDVPGGRGTDRNDKNSGWMNGGTKYKSSFSSGDNEQARRYFTGTAGGDATDTEVGNDGYSDAHENRPPYYALYYIMRIK